MKEHPPLKGFAEHGVVFNKVVGTQAKGDCPFCGKADHLYVNHNNRMWDCKACGQKGGFGKFLLEIAKLDGERFSKDKTARAKLAESRGLSPSTLEDWGVGFNGEFYTVPVPALDGSGEFLCDLRRYRIGQSSMSTSGGKVGLVGAERMDAKCEKVWLCEGEWDAMAMSELLDANKQKGVALGLTGAEQFRAEWAAMFTGKDVVVVFDNDYAGVRGENKVHEAIRGAARSLRFVHWPAEFKKGFDLRDWWQEKGRAGYTSLQKLIHDGPRMALGIEEGKPAEGTATPKKGAVRTGKGMKADDVFKAYRKWLHVPRVEPLEVMFGLLFANRLDGDPVWAFIVAEAGGCKTEFLMTLDGAPRTATCSTITPHALVSGSNFQGGGDPSLIPKLDGKVLVVKDFTVILSMHYAARDEIFSTLRDAYDGKTEKVFGTGVHRSYKSRFGIIAAVTPVIESYSSATVSLGERFLRYRIPYPKAVVRGSENIRRAINNSVVMEDKGRVALQDVAREVLSRDVPANKPPKMGAVMVSKLTKLAQWTATLRGVVVRDRYTGEVPQRPVVEIGTRLGKQLAKLAMGVALFHQRTEVSLHDYKIAARVARNTVPEIADELVKCLYEGDNESYRSVTELAGCCHLPAGTLSHYLSDLHMLFVVERDPESPVRGGWRLTRQMLKLMAPLELYTDAEEGKGNG